MIPFYRPYFDQSELVAALCPNKGRAEFESALAACVGVRYCITFAYGRSCLIALLKALEINQADVILPAYTCAVMAQAVVASGNRPAFADINLDDFNMDIAAFKAAITPQTRVVVATHLYGYPTDVDAIRAAINDKRVILLEDCAQGLPSFSHGTNKLRGDLGLFSFGPAKPLSTAQGGAIVTNDAELYAKIAAYRDQKMSRHSAKSWVRRWAWFLASYLVFHEGIYGLSYRYRAGGINHRLLPSAPRLRAMPDDIAVALADFQARIGLAQLRKLDRMLAHRRALAKLYDQELHNVPGLQPAPIIPGAAYGYYTLRVARRDERDFRRRIFAQGVAVDQTYDYALPCLEPYCPFAKGDYPCAERAARQVINLPIYPGLSMTSAQYVADSVRRAFQASFKP